VVGNGFKLGKKYFGNNLNPEDMFFIEVEINGETTRLIFEGKKQGSWDSAFSVYFLR
jgi:hypothetical protein